MTVSYFGSRNVHETVVVNENGCFSFAGRVCCSVGPSSNDFLALLDEEKLIERRSLDTDTS